MKTPVRFLLVGLALLVGLISLVACTKRFYEDPAYPEY